MGHRGREEADVYLMLQPRSVSLQGLHSLPRRARRAASVVPAC